MVLHLSIKPLCHLSSSILAQILHHVVVGLALLAEVCYTDAAGTDHLARKTVFINLAQAGPLTKLFVIADIDQWHILLEGKGLHQLLVCRLVAGFSKKHHLSFSSIEVLGNFMQTTD